MAVASQLHVVNIFSLDVYTNPVNSDLLIKSPCLLSENCTRSDTHRFVNCSRTVCKVVGSILKESWCLKIVVAETLRTENIASALIFKRRLAVSYECVPIPIQNRWFSEPRHQPARTFEIRLSIIIDKPCLSAGGFEHYNYMYVFVLCVRVLRSIATMTMATTITFKWFIAI